MLDFSGEVDRHFCFSEWESFVFNLYWKYCYFERI